MPIKRFTELNYDDDEYDYGYEGEPRNTWQPNFGDDYQTNVDSGNLEAVGASSDRNNAPRATGTVDAIKHLDARLLIDWCLSFFNPQLPHYFILWR